MSQKEKNANYGELSNIRQIFKQEEEWKHLLAEEVNCLQQSIARKEEKISEQKVQLDELKVSFFYNYDLLKSCDAELANYSQALSKLQTILAKREAQISELQISLDQAKDDLVRSQRDAVDWQARFEDEARRAMAQETELRRASNLALIKLAESEAAEKRRLTAEVTRAQVDLQSERARAGADLEAALADASRRASDVSAEAGRARLKAEMRANTAEDVASRARQESKRLSQELLSANGMIAQLESDVAAKDQAIHNAEKQLSDMKEALEEVEKAKAAWGFKFSRLQLQHRATVDTMTKEIALLKESGKSLKMQVYELNRCLVSVQQETGSENRRFLNAVAQADNARNEIKETLKAAESELQSVLDDCMRLETENRRLRCDLSRALDHNNTLEQEQSPVPRENAETRDLLAQVASLQLSCDKLQSENQRLRQNETGNADADKLKRHLRDAYQQVEHLTKENAKLLQSSNKMRARQVRKKNSVTVPTVLPRRRVEVSGGKGRNLNLGKFSPELPVREKLNSRGGDEVSLDMSSDYENTFQARFVQQVMTFNADANI